MLNDITIKFNAALRRAPLGGVAAREECARRSEVTQR
jgi:hypothetical protein